MFNLLFRKNKMDNKENTGDCNTGYCNTGDCNTGNCNTGNCNTGNWNTGYCNTGNCNTGNWNTGNWNTGYCNTIEPTEYLLFNKLCSIPRDELSFPSFFYFEFTEWVDEAYMTEEEKKLNPTHKATGGFLRVKEYQEAWRESWDKASDGDRRKCLSLPNWDNEVFKDISGIDVEKELKHKETIKIGDVEFDKSEVEKRLQGLKPIN
jgi:hypothetical protein